MIIKFKRWPLVIFIFVSLIAILSVGVFASQSITLNSGNDLNHGAGSQSVNPCDNDVTITPLIYNSGNEVYLSGFQYDNADKAACVGYDFETRFVSSSDSLMPEFATSSISSENTLTRVFSSTSSTSWKLGQGANSSEVTVTEISASSFQVTFATPLSLASSLGKIVMAEIKHLPLFSYSSPYSTMASSNSQIWANIASPSDGSYFYVIDQQSANGTGCIYRSSLISSSFSSTSLNPVAALPCGDGSNLWYGLGTSADGKYVAATGTGNRLYISSDTGVTWETMSSSTYAGGSTNGIITMSADAQVVCMVSGNFTANIWKNGTFWSKSNYFASINNAYAFKTCNVSSDGSRILLSTSHGLRSILVSNLTSGANTFPASLTSVGDVTVTSTALSSDGKYMAYVKNSGVANSLELYYSSNYGGTFTKALGVPQAYRGQIMNSSNMRMSKDGRVIAVALFSSGSQDGGVYVSNDYGANFTATSLVGLYTAYLGSSSDLSRIFSDDTLGHNKIYVINSD